MPLAHDPPGFIVNDYPPNRTAAFFIPFARQQDRDPHEVPVCKFAEESVFDDRRQAPGGEMSNGVQNLLGNRRIAGNKCFHRLLKSGASFSKENGKKERDEMI